MTPDKLPKLIVILGPTASGKTGLSIELAKKFKGEIVSADSRQVYKGMDIGTDKISKKDMEGIPHHLLDIASPKRRFTIVQYQKMAYKAIKNILNKRKVPFLVGGSPFYVYSIVEGWVFPKLKTNAKLRKELERKNIQELFAILEKLDPKRADSIDRNNKRRIIRSIEICDQLGKVSPLQKKPLYNCLLIGVKKNETDLKNLIHTRLLKWMRTGLIAEVKRLRSSGLSWQRLEEFGLEYRWTARFLQGEVSRQEMINNTQKDIEHFVKRQMTWFRKTQNIYWVNSGTQARKLIEKFLQK